MRLLTSEDINALRRRLEEIEVLPKPVVKAEVAEEEAVAPARTRRFSIWKKKKGSEPDPAVEGGAGSAVSEATESDAETGAAASRPRSKTLSSLRRKASGVFSRQRSHTVVAGADTEAAEQGKKERQRQFAEELLRDLAELDLHGTAESLVKALLPIFERIAVDIEENGGFKPKYEKGKGRGYRQKLSTFVESLIWRVVAYEELVLEFLDAREQTKIVLGSQERDHRRRQESDAADTIRAKLDEFANLEQCLHELTVVKDAMEQVIAATEHGRASWSDYKLLSVSSEADTDDKTFCDNVVAMMYRKDSERPWDQHVVEFSCRGELSQAKAQAISDALKRYAEFAAKPSVILDFAGCQLSKEAWQTICDAKGFDLVCSLNLSGQPRSLAMMNALTATLQRYNDSETPSRLEELVLRDAGLAVPEEALDPDKKGFDYQDKSPLIALSEGLSTLDISLQHVDLAGNSLPLELFDADGDEVEQDDVERIEDRVRKMLIGCVATMLFGRKNDLPCQIDLSGVCADADELEQVLNACPSIPASLEVISDLDMATVASATGCMLAKPRKGRFLLRLSDGRVFIAKSAADAGDVVALARAQILRKMVRQQVRAAAASGARGRSRTVSVSTTAGHVAQLLSGVAEPVVVAKQILEYRASWLRIYNELASLVQSEHLLSGKEWRQLDRNVGLGLFDRVAKAEKSRKETLSDEKRNKIEQRAEEIRSYVDTHIDVTSYIGDERGQIVDITSETVKVLIYNFVSNWGAVMAQLNELRDGLVKWQSLSEAVRAALDPAERPAYLINVLQSGCTGLERLLEGYLGRPAHGDEEAQPALEDYQPIAETKRGAAILSVYQQARYVVKEINKLLEDARAMAGDSESAVVESVLKVIGGEPFTLPADSPLVRSMPVSPPTTPRDEVDDGADTVPTAVPTAVA